MDSLEETPAKSKETVSGVGVLDKSVGILALLAEVGPTNLSGVVEATGIPRPTAHRLLSALEAHHLVARGDGRYRLGLRLLGWGEKAAAGTDLVEAARPALEGLRDASGESVQLYIREGDRRVCVASVERMGGGLRDAVPIGAVLPLEFGSGGRVLLAWSEDAEDTDELRETRRRGWAESVAERESGVASVSAPVFGPGGELRAAVCASGPVSRLGENPGGRLAERVVAAAREIGRGLSS
ncbi:MAG: IclR family transcriptional regulator [Actinomycetota bacterium]|nr:IclR family transcriptional regulator [Actinomycetota bacterium]